MLALLVASVFLTSCRYQELISRQIAVTLKAGEKYEMVRHKREPRQIVINDQQLAQGFGGANEKHDSKDVFKENAPLQEFANAVSDLEGKESQISRAKGGLVNNEDTSVDSLLGYSSLKELEERHHRFPSVDERVQVYMTNWYLPPCENVSVDKIPDEDFYVQYNYIYNATIHADVMLFRETRTWREKVKGVLRHFIIDESTGYDLLHFMTKLDTLTSCRNVYCRDLVRYLLPAMDRSPSGAVPIPILYQFSDAEKTRAYNIEMQKYGPYPAVPHMKKFRLALTKEERDRVVGADRQCSTVPRNVPQTILQTQELLDDPDAKLLHVAQPIVFKLKIQRHYGYVEGIPAQDMPWSKKKSQAIFRGQFTGRFPAGMSTSETAALSVFEQCQLLHRCRLVYNAAKSASNGSSLVDAKLVGPILDVRKDFPKTIDGIDLYGDRTSIDVMLSYKAIIMLEGNDVSSGLKWALFSNSVVLTQTPTKTSWAMEELLEPWVHYVPLADDLSDVEEKMQWVLDHDDEAQKIAHRGKLWISDLAFHPDAGKDDDHIFDEILRRYRAHFRHNPMLRLNDVTLEQ